MRDRRLLAVISAALLLGLGGEAALAGPIPQIGPPAASPVVLGTLRLRPWRIVRESDRPVPQAANVVAEGGEIILSQGSLLPWHSFSPPATPSPRPDNLPAPRFEPLSVQPVLTLPANSVPSPVLTTPSPTPEPIGLGILNPPDASVTLPSRYDAFVNFTAGPYPAAGRLTSGNLQPWYTSPVVQKLYGNRTPTPDEQWQFTQNVVSEVRDTYLQSGLDISLTTDPAAQAAHTLSVVANGGFPGNDRAIGIADLGGDGFTFIDKFTEADTLAELETSIAKNVAHELMHTFGVDHQDSSGQYLDAAVNSWNTLFDTNTAFGPDAVAKLAAANFQDRFDSITLAGLHEASSAHRLGTCSCHLASPLGAQQAVPEPTTVALWSVIIVGAVVAHRRSNRR